MIRTRSMAAVGLAVTALAGGAVGTALAGSSARPAAPPTPPATLSNPDLTGFQLISRLMRSLQQRDARRLGVLLAPSFMRQRADGAHETKAQYIASMPPVASYQVSMAVSYYHRGALTVRWQMTYDETQPVLSSASITAPQLSTFAWTRKGWRMTSHANFAKIAG